MAASVCRSGAILLLAAGLSGCVSSGTKVDQAQLSQFVTGRTTYTQVVGALGPPNAVADTADGRRVVVYSYTHAAARPESFIPLVGPFIGGADATTQSVTFIFDQAGVLQSGTSSQAQTGMGENLAAGTGQTSMMPLTMPAAAPGGGRTLGILVAPVSQQLAAQNGLYSPHGAFVASVTPGGAAQRAGVRQGDIILQLGYDVIDAPARLASAIDDATIGKSTPIIVWRDRARLVLSVNL